MALHDAPGKEVREFRRYQLRRALPSIVERRRIVASPLQPGRTLWWPNPVLAAMLAEWKLGGWAEMMGRAPAADDLIVPLPPDAAERRSRFGEPFRGHDYSGKRWCDEDLPALGWRHRRHYDMRATFITLAIEDGADPEILETRVTHTRKSRNAFDGYNRGLHGERTCAEIAKLPIARGPRSSAIEQPIAVGAGLDSLQSAAALASSEDNDEKSWRRRESNPRPKMDQDELLRV